jgi:hypothetical protein
VKTETASVKRAQSRIKMTLRVKGVMVWNWLVY